MELIFVVDDDDLSILELIVEYLRKDGYTVKAFTNGDYLIEQVKAEQLVFSSFY
jgi:CheY-like chemotaxis protein